MPIIMKDPMVSSPDEWISFHLIKILTSSGNLAIVPLLACLLARQVPYLGLHHQVCDVKGTSLPHSEENSFTECRLISRGALVQLNAYAFFGCSSMSHKRKDVWWALKTHIGPACLCISARLPFFIMKKRWRFILTVWKCMFTCWKLSQLNQKFGFFLGKEVTLAQKEVYDQKCTDCYQIASKEDIPGL